jgi:cytochrome P450
MTAYDETPVLPELKEFASVGLGEDYTRRLHELRARGPVWRAVDEDGVHVALVTEYADAREALNDNTRIRNHLRHARTAFAEASIDLTDERIAFGAAHLVHADPPDHTRLRRLVSRAFGTRAMTALTPRIEAITANLLDRIEPTKPVEIVAALNHPLPVQIISELLGVPAADRPEFRRWCEAAVTPEHITDAPMNKGEGRRRLQDYLTELVADRARRTPSADGRSLIDELLRAGREEDRISTAEVVAMAYILFLAGHESTVNFLGNAELDLAENPELYDELRRSPDLIPRAVEELLRVVGPVQRATIRVATEPVKVASHEIGPSTVVSVHVAAANRDPNAFPMPDRVELCTDRPPHLAFGHGPHFCIGAALARAESRAVLRQLTDRFRRLVTDEEAGGVRWRRSFQRGPAELHLRLEV